MDTNEITSLVEKDYKNQTISLSNSFIRSREYTNLLESKIEVLAIYYMDSNLKQREKIDTEGNRYKVNYVDLSASDIRALMGRNDGKSYSDIRKAAIRLEEKLYIIEDKENKRFSMRHMYGDITYEKGMLSIEFNPGMEKYFMNLKDNFTKLRLPIMFTFKKNGGFQLYKLLKSYVYPPNLPPIDMSLSQEELPSVSLPWTLVDLRMEMGYVDISQDLLKNEGKKSHPNWEKMAAEEKHPQYKRWVDFNKRVIEPGVEEINEISDIYIREVIKTTSGHGGKVTSITFVVQHNKYYYDKNQSSRRKNLPQEDNLTAVEDVLNEDQMDEFLDEMRDILPAKIKTRDLKAIAKASGYDIEKIKKACALANNSAGSIDNIVGWMISAIKDDYSEPVNFSKTAKSVHFELEREYDFDQLEEMLLNNRRKSG